MPIEPLEPEDRVTLTEVLLGLTAAIIIAPGVIWWIGTIIALVTGEHPW